MHVTTQQFVMHSDSHEYVPLSWYARMLTRSDATEMVQEEDGHQIVWGLPTDGVWRKFVIDADGAAMAEQVNTVVGTIESPERMTRLVLELSGGEAGFAALHERAKRAYAAAYRKQGLPVYYARKSYEMVMWQFFGELPKRPMSTVVLPRELQTDLLRDVRAFYEQERTYVAFGKPYKRVLCLYGPPGTGKTSIVTAIASELDRPLAVFNVDSLRDDTFIELLSGLPPGAILLFEDVDSMFRSDRKSAGDGGMTFSAMLNALDGVLSPRGVVVFLTTNHLDRLDQALRRPGRLDRLVYVPLADAQQASAMWRRAFPRHDPPKELLRAAAAPPRRGGRRGSGSSHNGGEEGEEGEGGGVSPAHLADVLFRVRNAPPVEATEVVAREMRR